MSWSAVGVGTALARCRGPGSAGFSQVQERPRFCFADSTSQKAYRQQAPASALGGDRDVARLRREPPQGADPHVRIRFRSGQHQEDRDQPKVDKGIREVLPGERRLIRRGEPNRDAPQVLSRRHVEKGRSRVEDRAITREGSVAALRPRERYRCQQWVLVFGPERGSGDEWDAGTGRRRCGQMSEEAAVVVQDSAGAGWDEWWPQDRGHGARNVHEVE
ncbi:hypothetical protein R6Z07F_006323 [Ovis aries]